MNLTEQQRTAVQKVDADLCVISGAGCGKTSVLVERFLHLLDRGKANVSQIAAITFTEKAALEMKERIRRACLERTCEATSPEDESRWETYSREIERARIGTIHGLSAGMLREFPAESGVDPHFTVIEEGESHILSERAVSDTLRLLVEADDAAAVDLVDEFGFRRTAAMVNALLGEDDGAMAAAHLLARQSDEAVAAHISELVRRLRAGAIERMVSHPAWSRETEFLSTHEALVPDDKREQARQTMVTIAREVETLIPFEKKVEALLRINEISLKGGKAASWNSEAEMKAVGESINTLRGKCKRCCALLTADSEEVERRAAHVSRMLAQTFLHCREQYDAMKRERSALDFSDLLVKARDLLRDNAAVREHYREMLKFILVDEFQDTDALQVEIIEHLTADARGEYTDKRVFVVGDAKQSIYKFRGADVSVFRKTEGKIRKTGGIVNLDITFRARPQLVSFVNDFFDQVMRREGTGALYEAEYVPLTPSRCTVSDRPEVEFLLVNAVDRKDTLDECRHQEAELIARRIQRMVQREQCLVSHGANGSETARPTRYGDIAVLFRAMTNISTYEKALREHEIPYYLTSGGGFYGRQEIKDIMCFLKALENADDEIALAGVLRSPMFGLSDETLYWLKRDRKPLFQSITANHAQLSDVDREKLGRAARIISELRTMKDRYSLSRLITEVVNCTGYLWVLRTMFLGKQKVSNVRKLAEIARDLERGDALTLRDFVNYVNEFVTQEIREGEAVIEEEKSDVVKVTTIHKAKGLEYPVVFVADLSHGTANVRRPPVVLHPKGAFGLRVTNQTGGLEPTALYKLIDDEEKAKDLAESKRLLYVACTRARDYLVLSGVVGKGKHDSWMRWFDEKYDLASCNPAIPYGENGYTLAVTTDLPLMKRAVGTVSLAKQYEEEMRRFVPIPATQDNGRTAARIFDRVREVPRLLKRKERFSVTELDDYGVCPRFYELKHVYEIPDTALYDDPPSVIVRKKLSARERGTVVHRVFELWHPDSGEDVRKLIRSALDQRRIADRTVRTDLERELVTLCERFRDGEVFKRMRTATDMRHEVQFSLNIDGSVIEGKIDRTFTDSDGTRWVLDFKTDDVDALQAHERAKQYAFQVEVYCLAMSQLTGGSIPRASVYFLVPAIEVVLPVDRDSLERVKTLAAQRVSLIRANRFQPKRDRCELCPYGQLCNG